MAIFRKLGGLRPPRPPKVKSLRSGIHVKKPRKWSISRANKTKKNKTRQIQSCGRVKIQSAFGPRFVLFCFGEKLLDRFRTISGHTPPHPSYPKLVRPNMFWVRWSGWAFDHDQNLPKKPAQIIVPNIGFGYGHAG